MCFETLKDSITARRYVLLRVIEIFLEHSYNLIPTEPTGIENTSQRVEHLIIPQYDGDCEKRIDILEYIQLMNWLRKSLINGYPRVNSLRNLLIENFSQELLADVDKETGNYWLG